MRLILSILLLASLPAPALAQQDEPPAGQEPDAFPEIPDTSHADAEISFRLNAWVWYVSPSGELKLPGGPSGGDRVELEDLNLDTPRPRPYGAFEFRYDDWEAGFLAVDYSADVNSFATEPFSLGGIDLLAGDNLDIDFQLAVFEPWVGYRFYSHDFSDGDRDLVGDLSVYGGVRFYDLDIDARSGPSAANADELFIEPFVGLRGELELYQDFFVDLRGGFGGFAIDDTESFSVDIMVSFAWRPTPAAGVQIGYRQLAYILETGEGASEVAHEGALAGIFAGLEIRF